MDRGCHWMWAIWAEWAKRWVVVMTAAMRDEIAISTLRRFGMSRMR